MSYTHTRARRSVAALSLCLVPVLALTACGGGDSDADRAAGPETATTLTVATNKDAGPLNIFAGQTDQMTELVYDKLLAPSPYVAEPQPWLATSVEQVDAKTWEVGLRDDVKWHDGEKFTADDVMFSFHFMHAAPTGRFTHHINDTPSISTVVPTDDGGVRFVCDYACPELGTVTLADLPILPEHVWSAVDPADVKQVTDLPIGTGPFKLVDYSPTSGYRFEANTEYFAGKPTVDELKMPVIPDASATFTALRSGEIDATTRPLNPELVDQFKSTPDIGVIEAAPLQYPELKLNFLEEPFAEARFRTAVSRAVDRDQLLDVVALGRGRPATQGYVHPDAPYAKPDTNTPYDADEARTILDELGYRDVDGDGKREKPNGEKLPLTLYVDGGLAPDVRAAELLQEDFAAVGIDVSIKALDAGSISEVSSDKSYDMLITTNSPHAVADSTQFIMSHRSGNLWKHPSLPYPEFDALYEEWKATETNEDRINALYKIQDVFNKQPTAIGLYYPEEYWGYRSDKFGGWVVTPGYGIVQKWSFLPRDVAEKAHAIAPND
ncbi:ABC transporter substrate-binding protein [Gordonia sp. zg691]|uniref:ABC transporter substrate-binding protein n=1 Tax=Gordonia jinghuaiqii TaxID=2758710 RepID=A0A7D7QQ79_9ACTN|nr:ABC transporter substrate-binding protein [Gordonia jinghuaiqii]MBD0863182.1 ABC transporter substrate-binding protein [Gordonia jinghuaiqii]MCR5980306.1 peptide ABC transporter substrate-binding protein [Gordonia jinghuaiqii]QMT01946.1 ABC transporter substrate-binding protein [Gordonia jinghuaiqii]